MKKASFTKNLPRGWTLSFFLTLLACLTMSLQDGFAQSHPLSFDSNGNYQASTVTVQCSNSTEKLAYTDDNFNEGTLYYDRTARTDTIEFCGPDAWHKVYATFTSFDLAEGDTLFVYDGDIDALGGTTLPSVDTLTGTGVSNANGGWVGASCGISANPSGCLTFIFQTNGDNNKGTGWEAWVECNAVDLSLQAAVSNRKLACSDTTAWVGIPVPTFSSDCPIDDLEQDTVCIVIRKQNGDICPIVAANPNPPAPLPTMPVDTLCGTIGDLRSNTTDLADDILVSLDLGPGQYSYEIYFKNAPTKRFQSVFAVSLPSLVCNDEVNIPLNSGCGLEISPDDLLENPCYGDSISYTLSVTLGSGFKRDTTISVTGSGSTALWIDRETLERFGENTCGGSFDVEITRIFRSYETNKETAGFDHDENPDTDPIQVPTTNCNNGDVRTTCTTTVNFRDQTAPAILLSTDIETLVVCNEVDTSDVRSLISSLIVDNCDQDLRETFQIDYEETDDCFLRNGEPGTTNATVTITATDNCGNSSSITRDFTIERPTEFAVPESVLLNCSDYGQDIEGTQKMRPGVKVGYRDASGTFVVTDTMQLSAEEYVCGYILIREKQNVPPTDCGQKEIHTWSVIDWCDSSTGPSVIGNQFVEYTDTIAPKFVVDADTLPTIDVALGHFECTLNSNELSRPEATDDCSSPNVRIDSIYLKEDGGLWPVPRADWDELVCATYRIKWIAEDACHSQSVNDTIYQCVNIKDVTKPSVITTDELIVSIPNDWGATVRVDDVDAGSYDACGDITRDIRREDEPDGWGRTIIVRCEDIGRDLRVFLRVTDSKGNENIAWMIIRAENRIVAACSDLPDRFVDCSSMPGEAAGIAPSTDADGDGNFDANEWQPLTGDLLGTFRSGFGEFDCSSNGSCANINPESTEEQYQLINLQCGQYEIRRRFRLRNDATHQSDATINSWAHQTIRVGSSGNWKVTLPADVTAECNGDVSAVTPPIIEASACDVIAWEVEDRVFGSAGDACVKIERTYHIINWCNYRAGGEPIQMRRFENALGEVSEPRMVISNREVNRGLGYFTYIQVLKVQDSNPPQVVVDNPEDPCLNESGDGADNSGCDGTKTWTAWADDCTEEEDIRWIGRLYEGDGTLVKEINSPTLTCPVRSGVTYYTEFVAYDGCGNSGTGRSEPIVFWDCRPPVAYLINGVSISLTSDGTIDFWASDVDRGSFDNCSDQSALRFYVHDPLGDTPAPTTIEEVTALPTSITFDCFRVGNQAITVYVTDEKGNYDFATTTVTVQDNINICSGIVGESSGRIAGRITNSDGEAIEQVAISVNGGTNSTMTDADGSYNFTLAQGSDYTITPQKDINPLNGVSTFDLVLISKHILGITTLDTPYKRIAADINRSGNISSFDMVQLRQLILNITTEFPNNESWRFVDANHEFSDNPLADNFNEFRSINNLSADMMDANFIAIKVGDVSGNAIPNSNLSNTEVRSTTNKMSLQLKDQFVEAGQPVKVTLSSESMSGVDGFQFTMNHEGLTLINIEDGLAKADNFNTNLDNALTSSWNKTNNTILTNNLFTLNFQATTSGLLSELISINSDFTNKEAYDSQGNILDITLEYTSDNLSGFELTQNKPNPFSEETTVGFHLPKASTATLKVLDVQGKVLSTIDGTYQKGYNEILINAKELGTTGVLYYQLETADFVATKKMIIID